MLRTCTEVLTSLVLGDVVNVLDKVLPLKKSFLVEVSSTGLHRLTYIIHVIFRMAILLC